MLTPAPTNDPTPVVDPVNHQAGQTAVGAGVLIVAGGDGLGGHRHPG
jgi:hypothetical protein